jgi:hypothetical protein
MRILWAMALVTLIGSCTAVSKAPGSADLPCLPYPIAGVRPPFAESLRDNDDRHSDLEVSADGKQVAFTDINGRLVGWELTAHPEPILYAGGNRVVALTRYGGLYSIRAGGQLMRTDLASGNTLVSWNSLLLPAHAASAHVDGSGRYLAVSGRDAPTQRDVIVLDDCALSDRPTRDCAGKPWRQVMHTDSQAVTEAYLDGDLVVARETPVDGTFPLVVVRRLATGAKLRSWDPGNDEDLLVTNGYAIESDGKSGELHLRTIADGAVAGEVKMGEAYASHESGCYRVDSGAGGLWS